MRKLAIIAAALVLTACGQQLPESINIPIVIDDQTDNPFEEVSDNEVAENIQPPDEPEPVESIPVTAPADDPVDDAEPVEQEPAPAPEQPDDRLEDEPEPETQEPEAEPEPDFPSDEDLTGNDVIYPDGFNPDDYPDGFIIPDIYNVTLLRHEWIQYEHSTAIAPSPFNIVTMQITWDMQPGHTYDLRLDGIMITENIQSVWEFQFQQRGLPEDFQLEELPLVEIRTCLDDFCHTSDRIPWNP